jgi:zinc protease
MHGLRETSYHSLFSFASLLLSSCRQSLSGTSRIILLILALLFCPNFIRLFGQGKEVPFSPPIIQRVELLNGLRLLTIEIPGTERLVVNFLIKSGYGEDPEKKTGLAYLAAHSIVGANKKTPPQRWKDEMEFLEATFSIKVDADSTVFHTELPPKYLEPFFSTLAEILVRPLFEKGGLDQVKEDTGKLFTDLPSELQSSLLHAGLFGKGSCSHRIFGELEEQREIGINDVIGFHSAYYLPNNAAIIVAGPPGVSSVATLVREKFGGWTKGPQPPLSDPPITSLVDTKIRIVEKKESGDMTLLFANPLPGRQSPDYYSLFLLNQLLGGSPQNSMLERELSREGIQHQFVGSKLMLGRICGKLEIRVQAQPSSIRPILGGIQGVIEGLKANKIAEAELNRARLAAIEAFQKSVSVPSDLANCASEIELYGLPRDLLLTFPRALERVSADRLLEAAKIYLNPHGVVVILGNKDKIQEVLQ